MAALAEAMWSFLICSMVTSNCCGPGVSSLMEEKELDMDRRLGDMAGLFERDCQLEKVPLVSEGKAFEEPERWKI